MINMQLYLVYADVAKSYGCEISIFGIFSDIEQAKNCISNHSEYNCDYKMILLNEDDEVYLGGYTE